MTPLVNSLFNVSLLNALLTLAILRFNSVSPVKVFTFLTVVSLSVIQTDETISAEVITAAGIVHIYVTVTFTRYAACSVYNIRISVVTRRATTTNNKLIPYIDLILMCHT